MEQVNLGSVIEQAITRSSQNRLGEKPPVFVALAPVLPKIPWRDAALRRFLQSFLYESLLTSDANAVVEISLRRRSLLKDLTAFVGVQPSYWVQLRISGRGLKIAEQTIEDLFAEVGYRCEEWSASRAPTLAWAFSEPSTRPISKWFSVSNPHVINSAATCCCR